MSALVPHVAVERCSLKLISYAVKGFFPVLPPHMQERLAELRSRQRLKATLEQNKTQKGTVFVHNYGHDCDGTTYSTLLELPAEIHGFDAAVEEIDLDAEGPCHFEILSPSQAEAFTSAPSRDLHLEAFENGRPHSI